MKTKEEYEEAFTLINLFTSRGCDEIDCDCCAAYDKKSNQQHKCKLDLALNMFKELINEHFKPKENTSEFKHFELYSDSSLKNLTKKELIDYIKMLYHNWGVTDEQLKRVIDKAKELSDSNDELGRTICSLDYALSDVYNYKPYKFEELKPNMWVWDNVAKECLYVVRPFITTGVRVKYFTCLGIWNLEKIKKLNIKFEENRFFPMQYANMIGGN